MNILAILLSLLILAGLGGLMSLSRQQRRRRASQVPDHEVVKIARGVPARLYVDHDVLDGPRKGVINRSPADLVLTPTRLIIATRHGRVLELTKANPGSVRCTGPRRLIIEGERLRKQGTMKVRLELIVDDAESWSAMAAERLESALSAV